MKFYAEKYMNAFMQPLHQTTERKISFSEDDTMEKYNLRDETLEPKFYNSERKIETDYSMPFN